MTTEGREKEKFESLKLTELKKQISALLLERREKGSEMKKQLADQLAELRASYKGRLTVLRKQYGKEYNSEYNKAFRQERIKESANFYKNIKTQQLKALVLRRITKKRAVALNKEQKVTINKYITTICKNKTEEEVATMLLNEKKKEDLIKNIFKMLKL